VSRNFETENDFVETIGKKREVQCIFYKENLSISFVSDISSVVVQRKLSYKLCGQKNVRNHSCKRPVANLESFKGNYLLGICKQRNSLLT